MSWKVSLSLSILTGIFAIIALVINAQNTDTLRRRSHLDKPRITPDPILYPQKSGPRDKVKNTYVRPKLLTTHPNAPLTLQAQETIDKQITIIEKWDNNVINIDRIIELRKEQEIEVIKIIQSHHRLEPAQLKHIHLFLDDLLDSQITDLKKTLPAPFTIDDKHYQLVNAQSIQRILTPLEWMRDLPENSTDQFSLQTLRSTLDHTANIKGDVFTESQYRFFRLNTHLSSQ